MCLCFLSAFLGEKRLQANSIRFGWGTLLLLFWNGSYRGGQDFSLNSRVCWKWGCWRVG